MRPDGPRLEGPRRLCGLRGEHPRGGDDLLVVGVEGRDILGGPDARKAEEHQEANRPGQRGGAGPSDRPA